MDRKPVVRVRDRGNCYLGEIEMPLHGGGRIAVSSLGWSPWGALKKAGAAAKLIATNPALQPFIPAQVTAAIKSARAIAKLAQGNRPLLRQLQSKLSPAAQSVARSMLENQAKTITPSDATYTATPQPSYSPAGTEAQGGKTITPTDATYTEAQPPPYVDMTNPEEAAAVNAWGPQSFDHQEGAATDSYGEDVDSDDVFEDEEGARDYYDHAEPPLPEQEEGEGEPEYEDDDGD